VKSLEARLGQALFLRRPREVALTAPGERLSRACSEAMSLLRAALSDLTETGEGVLAITTMQSIATHWLAPRLMSFQLAHPSIAVRLDSTARVVDLARENIDVALRAGRGDWPGLESHFLLGIVQTPLCSPQTWARLGSPTRPEQLLDAPRIGAEEEWAVWFAAAGVKARSSDAPPLSFDAQSIEVAAALAGNAIALGSPIFFAPEIAQGRLVQPFDIVAYGSGYWLAYPAERRRSRKIVAFRDWLLARAAEDPAIQRYARLWPTPHKPPDMV